jgi:hypothetical protein
MATMGKRTLSPKKNAASLRGDPGTVLSTPKLGRCEVVISTTVLDVDSAVAIGSTLGIPIMREGFVTETGLLPSSSTPTSVVSTALLLG